MHTVCKVEKINEKKVNLKLIWIFFFLNIYAGSKTKQYCGEIRLYPEDPGLWIGKNCRHKLHDDPVRGDEVLQSARSYPGDGIQREW